MKLTIFTDGASRGNPGDASGGVVVGDVKYGLCFGITTNNVAEYRALFYALREALRQTADEVEIFSDSLLMVNQINGVWEVRSGSLKNYRDDIRHYLRHNFKSWTLTHIPREQNTEADRVANEALDDCKK